MYIYIYACKAICVYIGRAGPGRRPARRGREATVYYTRLDYDFPVMDYVVTYYVIFYYTVM